MIEPTAEQLNKMSHFFKSGKTKDITYRKNALSKLYDAILAHEKDILLALNNDLNKPEFESYASEIGPVLSEIKYVLKRINKWTKAKKIHTSLANKPGKSYLLPEPYGVCLIIGPWNYPFNLIFMPLIGAITAGNCVIIKPSEYAPKTQDIIEKIISQCFDSNFVCVLKGEAEFTSKLLKNKFDYIFFTGNTQIGSIVMQEAAKNLIPVTLELGGKNPCIVDNNVNLENTAKSIVWGKFFNAGQTCLAVDYVLVKPDIKEEFIKKLIDSINLFYGEDPEKSKDYARIINEKHFDRIAELIKIGKIVYGGDQKKNTKYISPTLIENITWNDKLMNEEVFGPILPILEYNDLDEAIAILQEKSKPLTIYFFSTNAKQQNKIINSTSSGSVCINSTLAHFVSKTLPFGGVGQSGTGGYHGYYSFKTFSHFKSVYKKPSIKDSKISYPPYNNRLNLLRKIFAFVNNH